MALVLPFTELGAADLSRVGGKGANLGEMFGAGFPVPGGFCVTTSAYSMFLATCDEAQARIAALDELDPDDLDGVREQGRALREHIESTPIPEPVEAAIRAALEADQAPAEQTWAVRSSATLEDLPEASFAGQQDTYLGIRGLDQLLDRVRACWASLFTDRALSYRREHGFGAGAAELAVVVQRMIGAEVSGILFTADPISGHRRVASIDASWGLGEALVSGLVDADNYRVARDTGERIELRLGAKAIEIVPTPAGPEPTETREVEAKRRAARALDEAQLDALVALANRVESHYGEPQDIEWCFAGGELFLVQTRPITTLYPIPTNPDPDAAPDEGLHAYISFNHLQVMTSVIRPLGIDTMRHVFPLGRATPDGPCTRIRTAGGRLYFDVTPILLRRPTRKRFPRMLTIVAPKMSAMLTLLVERGAFERAEGRPRAMIAVVLRQVMLPVLRELVPVLLWRDPARNRAAVEALLEDLSREWIASLEAASDSPARLAAARGFMRTGLMSMLRRAFPTVGAGVISWKLLRKLTGDDPRVDDQTRGLEGNVTTQMDLELADLADLARADPELAASLRADTSLLLDTPALRELPGGPAVDERWQAFIARYGHRAIGEIDLSTPRWADDPSSLLRNLVGMLGQTETGSHRASHAAARAKAEASAAALIGEARGLRRILVRRLLALMRVGLALREHPKFIIMRAFFALRRAMEAVGDELVQAGQLSERDDIWWLRYAEIEAGLAGQPLAAVVAERRAAYRGYAKLRPPRVMTSAGEVPTLPRSADLPPNTLEGVSASTGVVEGVARVILDPTREHLEPGEILVAPFTDPGWTPLFVQASALVMEIGGLMTHGSVVAREYGIPAVVGVDECTTRIRTGQRIRVDGDRGWVQRLDPPRAAS